MFTGTAYHNMCFNIHPMSSILMRIMLGESGKTQGGKRRRSRASFMTQLTTIFLETGGKFRNPIKFWSNFEKIWSQVHLESHSSSSSLWVITRNCSICLHINQILPPSRRTGLWKVNCHTLTSTRGGCLPFPCLLFPYWFWIRHETQLVNRQIQIQRK